MGYYSELSIDTRTCGEADEDARLDRRDGIMTRPRILAALEAQRFQCQQAAREVAAQALRNAALERAGELAELARLVESRRTIELNYFSSEAK